jgi:hypothetical protein
MSQLPSFPIALPAVVTRSHRREGWLDKAVRMAGFILALGGAAGVAQRDEDEQMFIK